MSVFQKLLSKKQSNSLFVNLILSFMAIIVLLVAFNYVTIAFSTNKVREEIIKYNTLNLQNTVDSYETHFELVQKTMLSFLIRDEVQLFKREPKYIKFPAIQDEIKKIIAQPLFINDIVIYSQANSQVLDKSKSTRADAMFSVFMTAEDYPESFWDQQFSEPYTFKILSASTFMDRSSPDNPAPLGNLFPVVFKTQDQDSLYITALLDAQSMFQQFHISINEDLFILDNDREIYSSVPSWDQTDFPLIFESNSGYMISDQQYYFHMKGSATGFTYINRIPMENLRAEKQMQATLLLVLIAAIMASILAALLFIRRINNPLQKVIESIRHMNLNKPAKYNIREFTDISDQFTELIKTKQSIHEEYDQKKPIIDQFHYLNRLKDIRSAGNDELTFTNKPFVLILFEFAFIDASENSRDLQLKWYSYMKEFIDISISLTYKDTITFLIEKNQILSFVFLDLEKDLLAVLENIKSTIEQDRQFGFATIAISSPYEHSSELTRAYEESLERLKRRTFGNETEIVSRSDISNKPSEFSYELEQKFDMYLQEGNEAAALEIVEKVLARMQQNQASVTEVKSVARLIQDKCMRILISFGDLTEDDPNDFARNPDHCNSYPALMDLLGKLIARVGDVVQLRKRQQQTDPIIEYVTEYVEQHFAQEIYLDALAERLNISSGYLSTYFKEKTGTNFIDYLNGIRIAHAQTMLTGMELKIRQIAEQVGYQNINSFNRMFKKFTGVTPGEYRKQHAAIKIRSAEQTTKETEQQIAKHNTDPERDEE